MLEILVSLELFKEKLFAAVLTKVKLSNGSFLVQGKVMTSFTNQEEKDIKLDKVAPFLLKDELQKRWK